MKHLSFRLKIALLSAVISGLALAGFGVAAWFMVFNQKLEALDTEIRSLGMRHPGWLGTRGNFDRLSASLEFIFGEEHKDRIIFLVKDADEEVLYTHPGWPEGIPPSAINTSLPNDPSPSRQPPLDAAHEQLGLGGGGGRGFGGGRGAGQGRGSGPVVFNKIPRFLTVRTPDSAWRIGIMGNDDLRLIIGLDYTSLQSDMNQLRNGLLIALGIALLLVGGGGWLVAGRAMRPIHAIARAAGQVTAKGLDQRIPESSEDPAIRQLIEMLNGMMNRLETSFKQANRFSADASHELKTPLAVMQSEIEHAMQQCETGSSEQTLLNSLLEQTQHLKRITGSLLLLAQADSGQLKLTPGEFSLSEDLAGMVEDAQAIADDQNIGFEVSIPGGVTVRADRGLLRMALLNLITNAVRYNERGGKVSISLNSGDRIILTICNSGPGIPLQDQPHIFERFYRVRSAGAASAEGLGLGLSLAREILLAHGGEVSLQESRPGYTCFLVSLPK